MNSVYYYMAIPNNIGYHVVEQKNDSIRGTFNILNNENKRWVNDINRSNCKICNDTFNIIKRKHHCRICGDIFCFYCTTTKKYYSMTYNFSKKILVCVNCYYNKDKLLYRLPKIIYFI